MTARDTHDPSERVSVLSRLRRRVDKGGRRESTAGRRNPDEAHGQRSQTAAERRSKRARRKAAAPLFFGKQMLLFGALVAAVLVLDLFFYIGVALIENDASLTGGAPNHLAREAGQELEKTDDGWEMPDNVQAALDERGCWCILIGYDGEVAWHTPNAPESALRTYNLGDTAVFTRYGYLDDYPSFIWQRDDGLLVTCYPKGSYYPFATLYIPDQLVTRIPLYLLLMVVMDAAVFFAAYVISKRRVLKSVGPVVESLDKLAKGQSVHVGARGDLREVGESINAASAVMRRKDEARKRWVSGVSHDIRTPLAISMGHAERIATGEGVPEETRKSAETILRQSARIRDLVADLNIASKLEYDMQPLDVQPCALSKTVRSVAADYLNDGLDEKYELEVDVAPEAEGVAAPLDERLIKRALRNLVDNAIRHNENGCSISFALHAQPDSLKLTVSDDGCGISQASLAHLNHEAGGMPSAPFDLDAEVNGPTPPPGFDQYGPDAPQEHKLVAPGDAPVPPPALTRTKNASFADDARAVGGHDREAMMQSDIDQQKCSPTLTRTELGGFNEHGLGLSLVARIAAAHGGSVAFAGGPSEGFSATITLPLT